LKKSATSSERIEAHVQAVLRRVEARHGREFAQVVSRLLDNFIAMMLAEAISANIHPGKLTAAFITVIRAVEAGSDEAAFRSGDLRNN
jgi:hypothetical protein